jgi:hypothetical protein
MARMHPDPDLIVRAVANFREGHSYGPTLAEIGNTVGGFPRNTIGYHVQSLIEKGRLEANFNNGRMVHRSLRLPTPQKSL